jgi:hypothetical protein
MTDFTQADEPLSLERVIKQAWTIFQRNILTLLVVAGIVLGSVFVGVVAIGVVVSIAAGAFAIGYPMDVGTELAGLGLVTIVAPLAIVAIVAVSVVLQAAYVQVAIADLNQRPLTAKACLRSTLTHIWPLIGIGILMGIALILGFAALVVPGLILLTMWSVVAPVRVVENTGVLDTFSRSAQLTRGNRWPIFGLIVIYAVASAVVQAVLERLGGPFVSTLASGLLGMIAAIATAVIYVELRRIKDGVGPLALASVFD